MNSDDPTQPKPSDYDRDNATQPTITAVFRLLREIKQEMENLGTRLDAIETRLGVIETRFDAIDPRLQELEVRLARDIEGLNSRMGEGFRDI